MRASTKEIAEVPLITAYVFVVDVSLEPDADVHGCHFRSQALRKRNVSIVFCQRGRVHAGSGVVPGDAVDDGARRRRGIGRLLFYSFACRECSSSLVPQFSVGTDKTCAIGY